MINPYVLIGAGVLAVSLAIGGFRFGVKYQQGQEAHAAQLIAKVRDEARLGAAEAIAKMKVVNTTIKQQLETQIREREVYRNCNLDDDSYRLLNDALAGRASQPAGGGAVSGLDPADR